jgi:pimeloyl-ACP methyl ester carboxylesterase
LTDDSKQKNVGSTATPNPVLSASPTPSDSGYASVNGLEMYYEIYGAGNPVLLLHGGLGIIGMFTQLLPALAETRQVIAVELQGHGHTADIQRPIRLELMADDIAALIQHLGLVNADIIGYSMGGGVALQAAIQHPDVVRKIVVLSAPYKSDGWYPGVLSSAGSMNADLAEAMVGTIMHQAYISSAPRPQDWPRLVTKMGELMGGQAYDWSSSVAEIKNPALIVIGDTDFVRLNHAVEMFGLLGGGTVDMQGGLISSQLAILPGTTHYSIINRADLLIPAITPFLDAPMPEAR